ncbi:MAG: nitroreductase [Spirochaetes bacterium]|jgi:nitroreductase|nr:nitroreductase [Spirochaetota bacterium]
MNPVFEAILARRSIRKFTDAPVSNEDLSAILEAGRWAPSGLNNQPWRFAVIRDGECRERLSRLTHYGLVVRSCALCIAVFYHVPSGYNRDKDILGIGACIQNMLLAGHSFGLGAVWLGEILSQKSAVNGLLVLDDSYELMAVIALGRPDERPESERRPMDELVVRNV